MAHYLQGKINASPGPSALQSQLCCPTYRALPALLSHVPCSPGFAVPRVPCSPGFTVPRAVQSRLCCPTCTVQSRFYCPTCRAVPALLSHVYRAVPALLSHVPCSPGFAVPRAMQSPPFVKRQPALCSLERQTS